MKKLLRVLTVLVSVCATAPALAIDWTDFDPEDVLIMELRTGPVYIWMRERMLAKPETVVVSER